MGQVGCPVTSTINHQSNAS